MRFIFVLCLLPALAACGDEDSAQDKSNFSAGQPGASGGGQSGSSGLAGGGGLGGNNSAGGQAGGGEAGAGLAGGGQAGGEPAGSAGSDAGGTGGAGGSAQSGAGQGGSSGQGGGGSGGAGSQVTTIRVHYPVEAGHKLTIRGSTGGLTWEAGLPMEAGPEDVWTFSAGKVIDDIEWKPMIDDAEWARGPNYLVKPGAVVDVYPHFHVTSGLVDLYKEGFVSTKLAAKRDVWVYLPPTYLENERARFPVVYMHDGQNLFDAGMAFGGNEWQVDEAFDAAAESGEIREAIVIGVGNTQDRIFEYTPTEDPEYTPSGGGDGYLALLLEELKPIVDVELRTLPGPEFTAVVGSSLGGLFSSYAGVKAPGTFGLVGALSPSTWWDNKVLLSQVALVSGQSPRALRVYVDSGDAGSSQDGLADTKLLAEQYKSVGYKEGVDFLYLVQPGATHSEVFWAQRFPKAAAFLLGSRPDSGTKPF